MARNPGQLPGSGGLRRSSRAATGGNGIRVECFVEHDLPCSSEVLRSAFCYWRSKLRSGRLPGRADIDPVEMRGLLPSLMLVDIEARESGRWFRYRLMGEHPITVLGFNATGRYLNEVLPSNGPRRDILERYDAICDSRRAHYWVRAFIQRRKSWRDYERVAMPLAGDGWTVDMLLVSLVPIGGA